MANYTENYNLIKPEDEEYYDVADFNANMDVIDEALAENSGASEQLQGIISPDGKGVRVVKSIQTVHFTSINYISQGTKMITSTWPIQTVDPSRCIVLSHRAQQSGVNIVSLSPSLTETALLVHFQNSNTILEADFQIVEFY